MESQQTRVLVQLRDLILKGAFAPGERLAEIPIAERLRASRTPVRVALTALEQEGLVEVTAAGGYAMRRFTQREIQDAIDVRGQLEGMAARLIAEHGVPRQLSLDLKECLQEGDRILSKRTLGYDGYAAYAAMNDRLHAMIVRGCGNGALSRSMELNNRLPFAPASAMLPMQSSMEEGRQWMVFAHRQHHALVEAMERGQGTRAQALGQEHVYVAKLNLDFALQAPDEAAKVMPAIKLVSGGH